MKRPNVLWIIADQLRYHALGRGGDPNVSTPNIDALADSGVWCNHAISHYPVCVPFRAGLVTGLMPSNNGVTRHGDFLDPGSSTIAHTMNANGYRTSWVGKWHLAAESGAAFVSPGGWHGQDYWVHPRLRGGFTDWYGFNISNNYLETYICEGEKVVPRRLDGYQTDALTDISLDYLQGLVDAPSDQPWFHVVSYESPHPGAGGEPSSPGYPVPAKYESLYDPDTLVLRPNVPEAAAADARRQLAGYYRLITNLDDNVGRLLDWLSTSGQADDTLVVFLSDHGEMGGSHGLRNKQVPYEESLHVPLIFRLPGVLGAGAVYDELISGIDVYLTTLGLCGLAAPAASADGLSAAPGTSTSGSYGFDGLDHSGALAGDDTVLRDSVLVEWNDTRFAFGDHPYRAVRTKRHTLVVGRDDEFCLLFDREEDPFEVRNLYWLESSSPVKKALGRLLLMQMDAVGEDVPSYVSGRVGVVR